MNGDVDSSVELLQPCLARLSAVFTNVVLLQVELRTQVLQLHHPVVLDCEPLHARQNDVLGCNVQITVIFSLSSLNSCELSRLVSIVRSTKRVKGGRVR